MANKFNLDLSQFKAPGIYTVEFDASEYTAIEANTLRLVVGFSRKGPFNTPVLVSNKKEAIALFGDIDSFLEQRGSFFHRSIFTCLTSGPILALNLLPLNNGQDDTYDMDTVQYKSFSLSTSEKNARTGKSLYSSFYDKERFWKADQDNFQAIVSNDPVSVGKILSITNLGQKPLSILVRKADVSGFNVTAREFFGSGNVPDYVKEFDYVSDYFIEVMVVEGVWEDYQKLSADPTYSKYFDSTGLKKSEYRNFFGDPTVTFLGSYIGTIIPDFIDGNGVNQSIDTIMNNDMMVSGLYSYIDRDLLMDYANRSDSASTIDVIGHEIAQGLSDTGTPVTEVEFLSYRQNLTNVKVYTSASTNTLANTITSSGLSNVFISSAYLADDRGILNNKVKIKKPASSNLTASTEYTNIFNSVKKGTAIVNGYETMSASPNAVYFSVVDYFEKNEVDVNNEDVTYLYLTVRNKRKKNEHKDLVYSFEETNLTANTVTVTGYTYYGALEGTDVYFKPKVGATVDGLYAKVKTVTRDTPNGTANLVLSGTSDTLSALAVSNVNYDIVVSNYYPLQTLANATTLEYTLDYSEAPTLLANIGTSTYSAYSGDQVYKDYKSGILKNGDKTTTNKYIKYEALEDVDGIATTRLTFYSSNSLSVTSTTSAPANASTFTINTGATNISEEVAVITGSLSTSQKSVKLSSVNAKLVEVGDYVVTQVLENSEYVNYLTKVLTKSKNADNTYTITTANDIYVKNNSGEKIIVVKNMDKFITNYTLTSLSGFKMTDFHVPGNSTNKQSQLEKIIGVLDGTNLYKSLSDNSQIQFRYIVDTFDGGLKNNSYPKNIITRLAKDKQKCLAIMNAPSIKDFKESTDPRFTDAPDFANGNPKPNLKVQYIRDGGNLSLSPTSLYSLPTEEDGSKYAGFFISYPLIRENNRNFAFPMASAISNLYVDKFKNGTQYQIVAGTKRGQVTVQNSTGMLEYNFTAEDRAYLAEVGLNPLVYKQGVGYVIFDDNMAYQKTRSAFNNLSLRDLLITIEDGIDQILEGYLFDFNDFDLREEVSNKIRTFLQGIQINGGIYAYRVTMNEKNNTNETIQQGFGIVDVEIEPAIGIKKFVNRLTVHKTGGLSQSGFGE